MFYATSLFWDGGVQAPLTLICETGFYQLNGQAATFGLTGNVTVPLDVGIYHFTGQDVNFVGGIRRVPGQDRGAGRGRRWVGDGRYSLRVHGEDRIYEGLDALMEFLMDEARRVEESAKVKAIEDAKKAAKGKGRNLPPKMDVKSSLPEIQSEIRELQKRIDAVYKKTLFDETARLIELEDIKFLMDLDL